MAASAYMNLTLFLIVFFIIISSSDGFSLLRRQASILVSLKQHFGEESDTTWLHNWNLSNYKSVCTWNGLRCDDKGLVVSLDISNLNLSGSLSPSVTELRSLVNLSVCGNRFEGIFPPGIHKLSSLQYLNISTNSFNGSLEWDFSELNSLQVLDAYDNAFSGPLPVGVSSLRMLTHLDLGGNYLSGKIPPGYGDLRELVFLSLAGNDLRGYIPAQLGNLTNLQWLRLGYYNQFDGGIPLELGRLVNLVHLDLSSCGIKGTIPGELGNLNKLETLFLQTNQLSGPLPGELGNISSLKSLDLSINNFTGEIPVSFSGLKELSLLNLFINKFHGEIPQFVAEMPKLEVLKLWRNNFSGSIPGKLGQNGKLFELDLSTNRLTGSVPNSLCFGRRLRILILLDNFLFGTLPDDIGRCESLSRVRLGQNYLSGSIPNGLVYLPLLSLLELHNNYLTGKLEENNNNNKVASKLEGLNLSNNRLSGSLPTSIGKNFSQLKFLLLSGNHFVGTIPSDIGRLKNIIKIDMCRNNLSGQIPPEIGDCPSLAFLDLSQNQLSGPIPTRISQIRILNYFNISWNHLNRSLPKEFGSMKSLTSADFSHNNFSGAVPETGQYSFFNSTSFVGNPNLCGPFLNPCSNHSSTPAPFDHQTPSTCRVPGKYKLIFALGLLVCSLVFVVLAVSKTRNVRKHTNNNTWKLTAFQKLEFTSEDIVECLKDENIIGRGGAGVVYKGTMPNGEDVAVKRLGKGGGGGGGGGYHDDNGSSAEVETLGKIRHRYIVRLLGFCSNKESHLLIYEYMANGSLGEVLHGSHGGVHLKWDTRLKIAIEAAKGLSYLHHDCSPLIIHRDVKSNNILLSSDFEAHVADFGLAKFLQTNGTSQYMSAIAGSYGYIAPEYAYTLKIDEKSDVYSFGIVLLELITGRRPVGNFGEEGVDIVQWVNRETNGSKEGVGKILDERLNNVPLSEAMQVLFVAMLSAQEQSVERPTMQEVVQMLSQAKQPNTFHIQ